MSWGITLGLLVVFAGLVVWLVKILQAGGAAKQENKSLKNGLAVSRLMQKRNDEIDKETREELDNLGIGGADIDHPDIWMRGFRDKYNHPDG